MNDLTYESIARMIDHALLAPALAEADLRAGCRLAANYEVATVCIKPYAVPLAVEMLQESRVGVGTVIGFPHGGQATSSKDQEIVTALQAGAGEVDMVVNIGAVVSGRWDLVEAEIHQLTQTTKVHGGLLKVIFETCYLSDEQKIHLCQICSEASVQYVKTSTGFGTDGATTHDVALMRQHSPAHVKVKASGNIRDLARAIEFRGLGAERLGLSRTKEILDELCTRLGIRHKKVFRETKGNRITMPDNY